MRLLSKRPTTSIFSVSPFWTNLFLWRHKSFSFLFFLRGHGNESCNLIGYLPGQNFPISAHGPRQRFRESPSTSLLSLPLFINISRFSSCAVFCSKDVGHYPKPINNLWILSFLSQITLVERQILVSEWICISNSVITLIDKRPKNRLQLILIVHNKYQESWNVRYSVTAELIDGFFMHLISELSQTTWS